MVQIRSIKKTLQNIVFFSLLNFMTVSCDSSNWDTFKQVMDDFCTQVTEVTTPYVEYIRDAAEMSVGVISDSALAGVDAIRAIDRSKILFTGLGVISAVVGAKGNEFVIRKCTNNNGIVCSSVVIGAMLGASFVRGIYNVRADNAMLQAIEIKYGLTPEYNWYEIPGNSALSMVCADSDVSDPQLLPFMTIVTSKIEKMSNDLIFDFASFVYQLPHTMMNESYCMAKYYFNKFGCTTVGEIRQLIDDSLLVTQEDFKHLKKLTNFDAQFKLPKTLQSFNDMQNFLNQSHQDVLMYSYLGAFGYSPLHNCPRVRDYIIHVVKVHTYLQNLKELFDACSDVSDTLIQNQVGNLKFTLQYIHRIEIL